MDNNQQVPPTTTTVCVDGAAADASRADSTPIPASMPEVVGMTPAQLAAAIAAIIAAIPSTTAVAAATPNATAPAAAVTSKKKGKKHASKKKKAGDESGEEVAAKKSKGCNFTDEEVFNFLEIIEKHQPLSLTEWGVIAKKYAERFAACEHDGERLPQVQPPCKQEDAYGRPQHPLGHKEAKRIHWQMAGAAGLKTGSAPDKVADMTSVNANGGTIDDDSDTDDEEPVDFTRGPYNNDVDLLGEENNEDDFDVMSQRILQGRRSRNRRRKAAVPALPPPTSLLLLSQAEQQGEQPQGSGC